MFKERTFLWYDTETFGLDTKYDRVCEFAAVRTNMELEIIEEPITIRIRPSLDYIPCYSAMCVTGITPLDLQDAMSEGDGIRRIKDLFSIPGTIAVGYNSTSYDKEILRSSFFRELLDPYSSEYGEGRSTWDIIDLVRICHDLRPQGINWPIRETGEASFKLTDLTSANAIKHDGAHGALSDTLATLDLARLIKRTHPALFDYVFKISTKAEATKFLQANTNKIVLYTNTSFRNLQGCTVPVFIVGADNERGTNFYALNLLDNKSITALFDQRYNDVDFVRIAANKCPCLSSIANARGDGSIIDPHTLEMISITANNILPFVREAYLKFLDRPQKEWPPASDAYLSIYDGFFDNSASDLRDAINNRPPQEAVALFPYIKDRRLEELVTRKFCRDYPALMRPEVLESWEQKARERVLEGLGNTSRGLTGLLLDMSMDKENTEIKNKIESYLKVVENRFPGILKEAVAKIFPEETKN